MQKLLNQFSRNLVDRRHMEEAIRLWW